MHSAKNGISKISHRICFLVATGRGKLLLTVHISKMQIQGIKISFGAQKRHYLFWEEWQPALGHKAIVVKSTKLLISSLCPKYELSEVRPQHLKESADSLS